MAIVGGTCECGVGNLVACDVFERESDKALAVCSMGRTCRTITEEWSSLHKFVQNLTCP